MTVVENPGSLRIVLGVTGATRTESIMNIRPTAADQDLYDIGLAIVNLLTDPLFDMKHTMSKSYAA